MQRSRLSISQSRRRSELWRIFEVKYPQYIAFKIVLVKSTPFVDSRLLLPCDMMKAVAQTKPTSGELRNEIEKLRSTAARLQEQASRLVKRCAELEDLISRGTARPTKSWPLRTARGTGLQMVRVARNMVSALDRIGREQLLPQSQ